MIRDYDCKPEDSDQEMLEVIQKYALPIPEIYTERDQIIRFALLEKEESPKPYCTIPFDHTLEAEALGGSVRYGSDTSGPRAKEPVCKSLEELQSLPEIDFSNGRIGEVLSACRSLREQGEEVLFQMSGPLTIWNTLTDLKYVLKGIRKSPEQMEALFRKTGQELLRLLEELKKAGVRMVSYADSAGSLMILGPKSMEWMTRVFTDPFLQRAADILGENMAMILCPKTAFAMTGTGLAREACLELPGEMTYQEACVYAVGKAKFPAQMCINRSRTVIKTGKLVTIEIKEKEDRSDCPQGQQ